MSAFICGEDHFKVLAIFAASRIHGSWRVDPRYHPRLPYQDDGRGIENLTDTELTTLYADVLYQENIRSVRERYPKDKWEDLPGPSVKPIHIVASGRERALAAYRRTPVQILKMCDCLEYQSCETDDYRESIAFELLEAIRRAAIRELPGYEDAPWDYYPESKASPESVNDNTGTT